MLHTHKIQLFIRKTVILFAYKEILCIFATIKQNKKRTERCS